MNNSRYTVYEQLDGKLLSRCKGRAKVSVSKKKLYSLGTSNIDLCLSVFPWARFRTIKGAVKLYVGLDHEGMLPAFMIISDGKTHDITAASALRLPKGRIVVMDGGYTDYTWYNQLNFPGIFFVTRLRKSARYRVVQRQRVHHSKVPTSDQNNKLTGPKAANCPVQLRRANAALQHSDNLVRAWATLSLDGLWFPILM